MPEFWVCKKHDKGLLKAVSANGFQFLNQIISQKHKFKEYGFEDIKEEELVKESELL